MILLLFAYGCKEGSELAVFDPKAAFVSFGIPRINIGNLRENLDSLSFSFVFESDTTDEKILAFPLILVGQQQNRDREVAFRIVDSETTISSKYLTIPKPTIRANRFQDTLFVHVRRDKSFRQQIYTLALELQENSNFKPGSASRSHFKLQITDQFLEPPWWNDWSNSFGNYRSEVYQKWVDIYYPGADRTPPVFEGDKPNFAWNNMPKVPLNKGFYPVTYFFIDQLKKYFEDNAIYPDGDTSKPRIYLP
ncbi:MAG: hypothetical protein K0R59_203 [Sphingobacterium sp.]|jgi:hypothetical protein|nr:hypothetical protein [Sphingobacterium sp.]